MFNFLSQLFKLYCYFADTCLILRRLICTESAQLQLKIEQNIFIEGLNFKRINQLKQFSRKQCKLNFISRKARVVEVKNCWKSSRKLRGKNVNYHHVLNYIKKCIKYQPIHLIIDQITRLKHFPDSKNYLEWDLMLSCFC